MADPHPPPTFLYLETSKSQECLAQLRIAAADVQRTIAYTRERIASTRAAIRSGTEDPFRTEP